MSSTLHTQYLIVGQGLAGTLMAHFLLEAGQEVHIINQPDTRAASKVAAGLINPITGRRYVKSWRIDELIPCARATYRALEQKWNIQFYREQHIIRTLFNHREENDWMARSLEPGYESYFADPVDIGNYAQHMLPAFSYGEVTQSAQVQLRVLLEAARKNWLAEGRLLEIPLKYDELEISEKGIRFQHLQAERIIFCEGWRAIYNPFFNYLPFGGAKGEVLHIQIPDVQFKKILKRRIFIAPLPEREYWIGSTYTWNQEDDSPTAEGRQYLEDRLSDFLRVPYTVVDHQAAIRPTVKDRRPFLGVHPAYPQLFIFNGLGTKGASLGPFWTQHMRDYLLKNAKLEESVNIKRFE